MTPNDYYQNILRPKQRTSRPCTPASRQVFKLRRNVKPKCTLIVQYITCAIIPAL